MFIGTAGGAHHSLLDNLSNCSPVAFLQIPDDDSRNLYPRGSTRLPPWPRAGRLFPVRVTGFAIHRQRRIGGLCLTQRPPLFGDNYFPPLATIRIPV